MPSIQEMRYGVDPNQVQAYIDSIKAIVLKDAKADVQNIEEIVSVCREKWSGKAQENFIESLKQDADKLVGIYEQLFSILNREVFEVMIAMQKKDETLL